MKKRYRNTAFLAELLINILVFSISCAVLVGLFGKAAQLSRQTREETAAAGEVMAVVETVKAQGTAGMPSGEGAQPGQALLLYDADWQPVNGAAEAVYVITVVETPTATGAGTLTQIEVAAYTYASPDEVGETPIFEVSTAVYRPAESEVAA